MPFSRAAMPFSRAREGLDAPLRVFLFRMRHAGLRHAEELVQEVVRQIPGIEGVLLRHGARGGGAAAVGLEIAQGKEIRLALFQGLGQDLLDLLQLRRGPAEITAPGLGAHAPGQLAAGSFQFFRGLGNHIGVLRPQGEIPHLAQDGDRNP